MYQTFDMDYIDMLMVMQLSCLLMRVDGDCYVSLQNKSSTSFLGNPCRSNNPINAKAA